VPIVTGKLRSKVRTLKPKLIAFFKSDGLFSTPAPYIHIHIYLNQTTWIYTGATENAGPENARPENNGPIHRA